MKANDSSQLNRYRLEAHLAENNNEKVCRIIGAKQNKLISLLSDLFGVPAVPKQKRFSFCFRHPLNEDDLWTNINLVFSKYPRQTALKQEMNRYASHSKLEIYFI